MNTSGQRSRIEGLERAFWDSMVAGKPEVATGMLTEPAVMVSGHGAMKFDHAAYARMARDDRYKLVDYDITHMDVVFPRDDVAIATYQVDQKMEMQGQAQRMAMYDTSTWVKVDGKWLCAMHTESPVAEAPH